VECIKKTIQNIHLYPDATYFEAKKAISKKFQVEIDNIVLGNGSNELIDLLIRTYCEPSQDEVITSQAAFVAYKVCAHVNRCSITEVPLRSDFGMDIPNLAKSITSKHRIIFIPNPNNPTGKYITHDELVFLMEESKKFPNLLVVVDEAYTEYVRAKDFPRSIELFNKYKNLIILRTFAKAYGLAGLRLGFMLAHQEITQTLEKVRLPFNVSVLAAACIPVAVQDEGYIQKSKETVWQGLDYFYKEFNSMKLDYCTSQGNFIFFDTKNDSSIVFDELLKLGVILRPVKNYGFPTHMRMTVGLANENEFAIKTLKEVLK
jgi:histidinol-phosphate aminotransferase